MSQKVINEIIKKLYKGPMLALSPEELREYFSYRFRNLLRHRYILTVSELKYLLCETGPGNLRFDPEFITPFLREQIYRSDLTRALEKDSEFSESINTIVSRKIKIQEGVSKPFQSGEVYRSFEKVFEKFLGDSLVYNAERKAFIGQYQNIPVCFFIRNGEWVMPDEHFLSDVRFSRDNKFLPIFIAKKIHGSMFPLFKEAFILGINLYFTVVENEIYEDHLKFNIEAAEKSRESFFGGQKGYNDFLKGNKLFLRESLKSDSSPIRSFLEVTFPKIKENYFENFSKSTADLESYEGLINSMKGKKTKKILKEIYKRRQSVLRDFLMNLSII